MGSVKILLIEDSKISRYDNVRALTKAGYEVICADDGPSGLQFAQQQSPDLILLDLLLPQLSGLEVLRRLKTDPQTAAIPVAILTALSGRNREKLIAAGAEDYFEKSTLMPARGENLLPKALEDLFCRLNHKRERLAAAATSGHQT